MSALLLRTTKHLDRVESYVGHGNFNVLGFDEMLYYARNYPQIGQFSNQELSFLEQIFFTNPTRYGFYGQKITNHLTATISRASLIKIPYSGHFLLRGESLNLYQRLKKDVGEDLLLTSGVRSIVKQMYLFLAKTIVSDGNLSRASRSLAPPGHSYHEIGDFDVGKIGYGQRNFTSAFSRTGEYRKLAELRYVHIRYPSDNPYGVRFEPWHIKLGS